MTTAHWLDAGSGPAVVLLHAFPCDHSMWQEQVPALAQSGWRVLVPDLPGFGGSPLPDSEPALRAVVDILAADLLELGVDRLVLVGLSVGGYLAMEWLRAYPEMIAGVALCDTKATVDNDAAHAGRLAMAQSAEEDPRAIGELLRERMLEAIIGHTSREQRPEVVAQVEMWMDSVAAPSVAWFQRAMASRPQSLDTLRECSVPALVLWGSEDGMSGAAEQRAMLEVMRDARAAEIPAAGHLSAIENPDAVTAEIIAFGAAIRRDTFEG